MLTDEQLKEIRKRHTRGYYSNGNMVTGDMLFTSAVTDVGGLLGEVNRLRVERVHTDALGNDMAVIQDAIATGFWNIENIWLHIKTEEGDELARDVKQLWDALMWADFVRSSAYDHWDGFKFTKPAPPAPRKFFEGVDTSTLYEKTIEIGTVVKVIAVLHGATDAARFIGWTGTVVDAKVGRKSGKLLYSVLFKSGEMATYFQDEIEGLPCTSGKPPVDTLYGN